MDKIAQEDISGLDARSSSELPFAKAAYDAAVLSEAFPCFRGKEIEKIGHRRFLPHLATVRYALIVTLTSGGRLDRKSRIIGKL